MKRKKAVALVIVIVLIMLFSAIILSVVLTSTTAYRRSVYFRDRSIAFNLAHIGIADALYKLNHRYHDPAHYYGFRPDGECLIIGIDSLPANNSTYEYDLKASELGFFNASINDGVKVQLKINDGTYPDTLLAIGKYRGRTAKISVAIRTLSDQNTNLQIPLADSDNLDTKGIPEAFNKHAIYAGSVSGSTTIVKGNIATTSTKPDPWPATWTDATWTQTSIALPDPFVPSLPFEWQPPDPPPPTSGWIEFQMRGQPCYRIDGDSWQILSGFPGGGVTYSSDGTGTETFTFTGNLDRVPFTNRKIYVKTSSVPPGGSGGAYFNSVNILSPVLADGSITFAGNITLGSNVIFEADVNNDGTGTLVIHPNTTFNGSDLIVYDYNGNGFFTVNHSNITINGAFVTNCSLTIGPSTGVTIDATNSARSAAVIIYSPSTATFTLRSTPQIILGDNQNYAFLLVTTDQPLTVNLGTNGNVDFFANPIENLEEKATFVAYSTGSSASVNIGSGSNYARIDGLIFSKGAITGNISLNNLDTYINGCLVANGTVALNGGTLIYNRANLSSDRINIYSGFIGGRRIYIPFNWKLQW